MYVLSDDRENVKLLVTICRFSSVLSYSTCTGTDIFALLGTFCTLYMFLISYDANNYHT